MSVDRILHVVTMMDRAGLETMIMNYYRNIDRNKIQFDFLVHRDGQHDFDEEIEKMGGNIYCLPSVDPFNFNGYLEKIDDFFKKHHEYKIVHSHLDCLSFYPLKYAQKYGIPIRIAHSHTSRIDKDYKYIIKMILKRRIEKYATHLMACSDLAGEWMFKTKNFMVVNNAIDSQKFVFDSQKGQSVREKFHIENDFVIGHVGRFVPLKNHKFLLDIFENVKKQIPQSKLMLVGDGIMKEEIIDYAINKNLLNDIIFVGNCSEVEKYLQAMTVFVFPSLYEGLGISLIEAQAAGLKCFASAKRVPEEADITNLVTFLPLDNNPELWANNIVKYSNFNRKDMSAIIKKNNYDIRVEAEKLETFYLSQIYDGYKKMLDKEEV